MKKLLFIFILTLAICLPLSAANGPTEKVTVGSGNISDGSISTAKLADGSVTNAKVATGTFAELNGQATEDFAVKDLATTGGNGEYLIHRRSVLGLAVDTAAVVDTYDVGDNDVIEITACAFSDSGINNYPATYMIYNDGDTVILDYNPSANFNTTKDAVGFNVYVENNNITIQNKVSGTRNFNFVIRILR